MDARGSSRETALNCRWLEQCTPPGHLLGFCHCSQEISDRGPTVVCQKKRRERKYMTDVLGRVNWREGRRRKECSKDRARVLERKRSGRLIGAAETNGELADWCRFFSRKA